MRLLNSTLFLLTISNLLFAQNGKITGKVISSKSGEPLIGAAVTIVSIKRSVATDLNGTYTLGGLPAGTYSVIVSYVSYGKKSVDDVAVKAGEVISLNISLDEAATAADEVIVKTTRINRENASAVLTAQKNAASVSDGISAEAIRKTPDRNTSDVLKRVSGASIQDDRFVIIRGLNDRYNVALINGAPLPSSESDRKAFAFDIFPSNILDNLVIYKTATPDLPGEFAGGIINISTKSIPSKNFTSISVGLGYNTIATFKDKVTYSGGKWDFLGLDDGTRAMPSQIPDIAAFAALSKQDRANLARNFTNNWQLNKKSSLPYMAFQFAKGLNFERKGKEFAGMTFSLSYNRNPTYSDGEKQSHVYDRSGSSGTPVNENNYTDKIYADKTMVGALANFSLKLGSKTTLSWKNIYSINTDDKVVVRAGNVDYHGDPTSSSRINIRWFTGNTIYSSQLTGSHVLNKSNLRLDWVGGYSRVKRSIPDLRQSVYSNVQGDTIFYASINSSRPGPDNGGTHFYSSNDEKISSVKADFMQPFVFKGNKQNQLKFGAYYQKRVRDFKARLLGFYLDSFDPSLTILPEDKIFAPENLGFTINTKSGGTKRGFGITEGTKPSYVYDASSQLIAGYLMADQRFGKKLRAIYGARLENYNQKLNSTNDNNVAVNIDTTKLDILPSINLVYSLNAKQNLRASWSRTLNRPEFRELAPFIFFDFVTRYNIEGDTTLQRALIDNYDLRYEVYPGKAQLFSVSAFYKHFQNPIELVTSSNSNNTAKYQNANKAHLYGIEAEVRSLLSTLFHSSEKSVLNNITWSANGALIWSKVSVLDKTLGSGGGTGNQDLTITRSLQGQSPYLINTSFTYSNDESGVSATISANRVGDRIHIAGNVQDVDINEKARTILDFQAAKFFNKGKWELKLNVKDLLAQKQVYYYDVNEDQKYSEADDRKFITNSFGRTISISATYKF